MSGDAVDDEPSTALPTPTNRSFLGQSIIHANDASHHEQLLGYFMGNAEGKFFQSGVYVQGLIFKSSGRFWSRSEDGFTTVHFPKTMTCGLEAANTVTVKEKRQRAMRKRGLMQ